GASSISPRPAWTTMFRAISEMAVATRVESVREKPSSLASARPRARAGTMSASEATSIRSVSSLIMLTSSRHQITQQLEPFLQIERRVQGLDVELELHHSHGNVGLDADDHRLGATELGGQRDRAQRPGHE